MKLTYTSMGIHICPVYICTYMYVNTIIYIQAYDIDKGQCDIMRKTPFFNHKTYILALALSFISDLMQGKRAGGHSRGLRFG